MTELNSRPSEVELIGIGVDGKWPGVIADLHSIKGDLVFAASCASAYLALAFKQDDSSSDLSQDEALTARAMWSAALIAYRRAFAHGRSHSVPKAQRFDIQGLREAILRPEQRDTDLELRAMIDQHVAHRVSDLEQVKMQVWLTPPPLPRAVAGIGPFVAYFVGPEPEVARRLIDICDAILQPIDIEIGKFLDSQIALMNRDHLDALYSAADELGTQT